MSKNHIKVCRVLNYIEHLLILIATLPGCVSISAFASLVGITMGITSSAIGLKICVITAGIKKYMSIIKKKEKKHVKIVLLAKYKLNSIEVLISKALIDSKNEWRKNEWMNELKEFYEILYIYIYIYIYIYLLYKIRLS